LTAQQAEEKNKLLSERLFEDVLMRADVTLYQQHLSTRPDGRLEEKSIDVSLALEAYEMASLKRYDVCVLITGDGDFVPLVLKLNSLGSRVMLIGWDFEYETNGKFFSTRVSQRILDRVNYSVLMHEIIDSREKKSELLPLINNIFVQKSYAERKLHMDENLTPKVLSQASINNAEMSGHIISLHDTYGFIKPDDQFSASKNAYFKYDDLIDISPGNLKNGGAVHFTCARENEKSLIAVKIKKA